MGKRDKFEAALVRAKADWRRVCDSPNSVAGDRRKALVAWRKAQLARDRALALWRRTLAERRRAAADRRKGNTSAEGLKAHADRRKLLRRP